MTLWDALSVVALVGASIPSVYLAGRLWSTRPHFARLSALLAATFLVHALYHLMVVYSFPRLAHSSVEAVSAVMMLAFAVTYWTQRQNSTKKGRGAAA